MDDIRIGADEEVDHVEEDCEDPFCDVHYQTFEVELTQRVSFRLRAKDEEEANSLVSDIAYDAITVTEPGSQFADVLEDWDEGEWDSYVESEEDAQRRHAESRRIVSEIEGRDGEVRQVVDGEETWVRP